MADLSSILGAHWEAPAPRHIDPPELQLYQAIADAGLDPPDDIHLDGAIHRFRSGSKGKGAGDKTGWYIAYADGVPAGRFGCWRAGIESAWRADIGRQITPAEEMAHVRRMAEAKARRDEARKAAQEVAADTVAAIWEACTAASPEHPYLQRKGIGPHGARVTGDGRLVVPLMDASGELSSLQYITGDGGKLYHPGAATGGKLWQVGAYDGGRIYIAEGFATAATIHEATGMACVVAYSASNLVPATEIIRSQYPDSEVIIVADHDASGVGQRYAEQATAKYGGRVIMPPIPGDANDYRAAGHDLAALLNPSADPPWLIPADDLASQPAPISWLIKRWLQSNAMIMIHGPSGGGKTFVVLDMALRIASGLPEWSGHKIKPGGVVYLAGEGHHGLRGRIAAWKQYYAPGRKLRMYLSASGCDLNTPAGLRKAVDAIRALKEAPSVIIVDTLHRFLVGDENSAQDAKSMLDACAWMMQEFNCSVVLIHHTGVSDEAQHRARGSSAWRGALDIEISVIPGGNGRPVEIAQRKSKDAELAASVHMMMQSVSIDGWFDEDGDPVTSAVLVPADAPAEKPKKIDGKIATLKKIISEMWVAGGKEMVEGGTPYISRSAILNYAMDKLDKTEKTAYNYISPSNENGCLHPLIIGGIIDKYSHGYIVTDIELSNTMSLLAGR